MQMDEELFDTWHSAKERQIHAYNRARALGMHSARTAIPAKIFFDSRKWNISQCIRFMVKNMNNSQLITRNGTLVKI